MTDNIQDNDETFTISELSKKFSLTARALRFYETKNLIAPKRVGDKRLYSKRDKARLSLVIQGKNVGFSLDEIKEMLDLYDVRDGKKVQLQVSSVKFRNQIEKLKSQKMQIEKAILDLTILCDEVDKVIDGQGKPKNLADIIYSSKN